MQVDRLTLVMIDRISHVLCINGMKLIVDIFS
jgi:hypothetical protein